MSNPIEPTKTVCPECKGKKGAHWTNCSIFLATITAGTGVEPTNTDAAPGRLCACYEVNGQQTVWCRTHHDAAIQTLIAAQVAEAEDAIRNVRFMRREIGQVLRQVLGARADAKTLATVLEDVEDGLTALRLAQLAPPNYKEK